MQLIETTGEGKSAVATPDGKSRKKKKKYQKTFYSKKNHNDRAVHFAVNLFRVVHVFIISKTYV